MTWNGTTITSPVLIYQDEILVDPTGVISTISSLPVLVCTSQDQTGVNWHLPGGDLVNIGLPFSFSLSGDFNQFRSTAGTVSGLSRNRTDVVCTDAATNGLWTCRLNGEASGAVSVGIYARGGGKHEHYSYRNRKYVYIPGGIALPLIICP